MLDNTDFARYRSYSELTGLLKRIADEYPELVTVRSIGCSREGRGILLAEVTNLETGPGEKKPAAYFDANIHAGEVTGSAVALYLIAYLAENYGHDQLVTDVLDTRALYIVPRVSVDGAEIYLNTPQTLRSSTRVRPHFESEGGIHPEDIDGDGRILTMRVPSSRGEWKVSEHDCRLMVPRQPADISGRFYHLFTEGRLSKKSCGPVNLRSSKWPLDLNRNFPANWSPEGEASGRYPLSEPETRAVADFLVQRDNVSVAVAYHTAAGLIMRNPMTCYDRDMNPKDFALIDKLTARGSNLTGYPATSGYLGWSEDFPMAAQGTFSNWVYEHLGIFGYTVELWDMASKAGVQIEKNFGDWWSDISEQDMLKFLRWNDEHLDGMGFVDWQPFDHPELGEIEIGGWVNKWTRQNPPEQYLPEIMHTNALFALELAASCPKAVISKVEAEDVSHRTVRIYAEVCNEGFLPTSGTDKAKELAAADPVHVSIDGSGFTTKSGQKQQQLGHLAGYGPGKKGWGYLFNQRANDSAGFAEWIIVKDADEPVEVEITLAGQRGGEACRIITV